MLQVALRPPSAGINPAPHPPSHRPPLLASLPLQRLHRWVVRIEAIQAHLFLQRRTGRLALWKTRALPGPIRRPQAHRPAFAIAIAMDQRRALVQGLVDRAERAAHWAARGGGGLGELQHAEAAPFVD